MRSGDNVVKGLWVEGENVLINDDELDGYNLLLDTTKGFDGQKTLVNNHG
jgi:hypothetical protein